MVSSNQELDLLFRNLGEILPIQTIFFLYRICFAVLPASIAHRFYPLKAHEHLIMEWSTLIDRVIFFLQNW